MLKRQFSTLIFILCMFSFGLVACAKENTPPVATPTIFKSPVPAASEVPSTQPALTPTRLPGTETPQFQGTQIRFWYALPASADAMMQTLIDQFNTSNTWGISVTASAMGDLGQLSEQAEAAIGKDTQPDLITIFPEQARAWKDGGQQLVDLQSYLNDAQFGFNQSEIADFPAVLLDQAQVGGRLSGFPAQRNAQVLFYNQTWARELGFEQPPATPEEFEKQACAAAKDNLASKDVDRYGTGGWIADDSPWTLLSWIRAFGGNESGSDGSTITFNTAKTEVAFDFLKGMIDKGCAWVARNPTPYDYFLNRQALFYSGNLDDLSRQAYKMQAVLDKDEWILLAFPGADGKPVMITYGPDYSILQSTPEKETAAWLFVRWLSQADHQAALSEATGMLPPRLSALETLSTEHKMSSQWSTIAAGLAGSQAAPNQPLWRTARIVLQDAGRQLYRTETKAEQVPEILKMLDQTISEISEKAHE